MPDQPFDASFVNPVPKSKQKRVKVKVPPLGPVKRALRSLFSKATRLIHAAAGDRWWSAGGVVVDGRAVAIIRQKKKWTLPKGRIDSGESVSRAARREVFEETGLRADVTEYLGVAEGLRHDTHWFLMRLIAQEGRHDEREVDEVKFVKSGKAKKLLRSKVDKVVLERAMKALAGRPPKDPRIE
ncbi:MAG: NUDIX domain-containing protein [Myxococcaceae bacterium]|nr:NUDIX domain-containing protein [Myxococcaceae bacterium]